MAPTTFQLAAIVLLVAAAIFCALIAVADPKLGRAKKIQARASVALKTAGGPNADRSDAGGRKRDVEELIKDLAQERDRTRISLTDHMRQAGLGWDLRTYAGACVGCFAVVYLLSAYIFHLSTVVSLLFAVAAGAALPRLYVARRRQQRLRAFGAEFANAIDIIVRGIKSGLPVTDCLGIIASEAQEPVKSEIKQIVEDQTLGLPLEDAVQRLPARIPTAEAKFFAIVIAIQSRTGGSLSEALGNLSAVLRERHKMAAKIRAVSSEAKASAAIIASLPVIVSVLIYLTSPGYMTILFKDPTGHMVLLVSGLWMMCGVFVMKKMINFDF